MDLIYTDESREDAGVLLNYNFDLAFGSDENNFEMTLDANNNCCRAGCVVYIDGTEYGGIIDRVKVITQNDEVIYSGRTWHGILESKVIEPDVGRDYLVVSGDANAVIGMILERIGLSELFAVAREESGLEIKHYSMNRYVSAYTGIRKMLATAAGKLKFLYQNGKVILSAHPITDYSQDEQFDNDQVEMEIERSYKTVNHIICLGQGELSQRQVIHLYRDEEGKISTAQTQTGIDEITEVYDYPNAESEEELVKGGESKLKEYAPQSKVKLSFDAENGDYDIGDIVGAKEIKTGISAVARIIKKIVTINRGLINIEYKVEE